MSFEDFVCRHPAAQHQRKGAALRFEVVALVALLATRNPINKMLMPAMRVTANAVSAPRRPVNVPLADNVVAPSAMKIFPNANMRGDETLRVAVAVSAGFAPRSTR